MARKLIQTKKTTLAYGINDSATTMRLTNLLKLDGSSISVSDIGDYLTGTFDPGTSREEIFSIDGANVTVNSDGTVDITSVARGLQEVDPYSTGGFATDHPAGAIVVFGNNPQVFNQFGRKADANTWDLLQTFTVLPRSNGGNATVGTELVTYAQALAMATGTANINRIVVAGNAGETVTAGQLLYLDVADGEWKKCDADTAGSVDNIILGIAQGAGTDGVAITSGVLLFGLDSNQTGLTTNTAYYASNTAGGISTTPGTTEVSVGISRSTTSILFYPRYNQQITENEQDLLAKLILGTDFYAATATGNDTYVITVTPTVAYTNGIRFRFKADVGNTGAATLNVNSLGAITIKKNHDVDLATGDIEANQIVEVVYNSTGPVFEMISQVALATASTDVQNFVADGTWTKPTNAKAVKVIAIGGGGGGGGVGTGGNNFAGGGGGGAGIEAMFDAADLGSTESITVGASGAGGTAGSNPGAAGGNSSFGSWLTAYGGGGGAGAASGTNGGGGGGGSTSAGTSVTSTTGGAGGGLQGGAAGATSIFGGGGGGSSAVGGESIHGGGGGGGASAGAQCAGGNSIYGGGGGGNGATTGGVGGTAKVYGGNGGAGGVAGAGTAGTAPGGAGGGAGNSGAGGSSFAGGAGAVGQVTVITYF